MRSGPIRTEDAHQRVDRRAEVLPLWERGKGAPIDLPWTDASSLEAGDVRPLLLGARSAALAVGATATSRKLLDAVLEHVTPRCRLYVYGDRALEADAALVRRLAAAGDRVLARLGYRPPADWLVVDGGRDGRLLVGPTSNDRRWVIPVDGALARSLFEAFRVLFWFHTAREALPDSNGEVAFRTPLAAPFDAPGSDIPLPGGRLRLDGDLDDPVPDAEIRTSPSLDDPGRARVLFIPPAEGLVNGSSRGPVAIGLPTSLASRGHRVLWVDTGLPRTTVTRQRMVLDLVERPIALQLEWPRAAAIDFFHRFERAAQNPEWEFHPARRLGDVSGQVLLDGAIEPAEILPSASLDAGDVPASLAEFESARPARFPEVPHLALQATFQWRRVPVSLPPGARSAEIVRRWTAVDEWASRNVDSLRSAIAEVESQEGLLSRLRRWLPSRDAAVLERRQIREEIDEIGESRPSQVPEHAKDRLDRLVEISNRLDALRRAAHGHRQTAEDAQAEESQRSAWKHRIEVAEGKLDDARRRHASNEEAQGGALESQQAAQTRLDDLVASRREERLRSLESESAELNAELEAATAHQKSLDADQKGRPPKAARKEAGGRIRQAEQAVARNRRDQEGIGSWSPPVGELGEASTSLSEARKLVGALQSEARSISTEIKDLERAASEEFSFEAPPRLDAPAASEVGALPVVPTEAPPELGDLYEHRGERFLAIRTWEQLRRAEPVAKRLRAELVVSSTPSKG